MSREEFLEELRKAKPYEMMVADRLCEHGLPAVCTWEPDDPNHDYSGQVDVIVEEYGVEVKSQRWAWQGLDDFPHSHALGIKVSRWRRMKVKPIAVVHVSRPTGGMIVSPGSSFEHWIVRPMVDTLDRIVKDCYLTPREYVRPFESLVAYLQSALDLPSTAVDRFTVDPQELEDSRLYCRPHSSHFCPCCKPHLYDPLDPRDRAYIEGWKLIAPIVPLTQGER